VSPDVKIVACVACILALSNSTCADDTASVTIAEPLEEINWVDKDVWLKERGGTRVGLFGIRAESRLLETWNWKAGTLEKGPSAKVALLDTVVLPDGRYIACRAAADRYSDWPLVIGSISPCEEIKKFEIPSGWRVASCAVSVSRNGKFGLVVIESKSGKPRCRTGVIDIASLKLRWLGPEVAARGGVQIAQTAISDDGRYAAVTPWDEGAVVIDLVAEKVLWNQTPKDSWRLSYVEFSRDGSRVYFGDKMKSSVFEIDTAGGKVLNQWLVKDEGDPGFGSGVWCLALSPEDKWVAVAAQKSVYLIDIDSGAKAATLPVGSTVLSFSPDGSRLASVAGGKIKIWEVAPKPQNQKDANESAE